MFGNVRAADIPLCLRRKRNGNGSVVADNGGEQVPSGFAV
jgi:hypothetical protein